MKQRRIVDHTDNDDTQTLRIITSTTDLKCLVTEREYEAEDGTHGLDITLESDIEVQVSETLEGLRERTAEELTLAEDWSMDPRITKGNFVSHCQAEKKKLVPSKGFIDDHPLLDVMKKRDFKLALKHSNCPDIATGSLQGSITAIRTIASKSYSDMASQYGLYHDGNSNVFETQEEWDQHLDWMFDQLHKYIDDAKDLLKAHRVQYKDLLSQAKKISED